MDYPLTERSDGIDKEEGYSEEISIDNQNCAN